MDAPLYSDWLPRVKRDSDPSELDMTQFDLVVIEQKPGSLLFRMLPKVWKKSESSEIDHSDSGRGKDPETEQGQPDSEAES